MHGEIKTKEKGNMTQEREKLLDEIGFDWKPGKGDDNKATRKKKEAADDKRWMERFQQLKAHLVSINIIHLHFQL